MRSLSLFFSHSLNARHVAERGGGQDCPCAERLNSKNSNDERAAAADEEAAAGWGRRRRTKLPVRKRVSARKVWLAAAPSRRCGALLLPLGTGIRPPAPARQSSPPTSTSMYVSVDVACTLSYRRRRWKRERKRRRRQEGRKIERGRKNGRQDERETARRGERETENGTVTRRGGARETPAFP